MKRTNFILNGFLALATVLVFAQCTDKNNNASTTSNVAPVAGVAGSSNMKIAYVEIDSLLTKYNFWNDLNEAMISKEENIRTTLNEKVKNWKPKPENLNVNFKTEVLQVVNVQNRNRCV